MLHYRVYLKATFETTNFERFKKITTEFRSMIMKHQSLKEINNTSPIHMVALQKNFHESYCFVKTNATFGEYARNRTNGKMVDSCQLLSS